MRREIPQFSVQAHGYPTQAAKAVGSLTGDCKAASGLVSATPFGRDVSRLRERTREGADRKVADLLNFSALTVWSRALARCEGR